MPKSQGTAPIPWQQSVPAQRPWQAIGQIGCRDHECSREQLGSRTLPRAPLPFASHAVEFPSSISTRRGPRQVGRAKRSSTWGRTRSASARCSVSSVPSGHIEIPLPARGHEHSPHWERLRMAVAWSRSLLHPKRRLCACQVGTPVGGSAHQIRQLWVVPNWLQVPLLCAVMASADRGLSLLARARSSTTSPVRLLPGLGDRASPSRATVPGPRARP